MQTRVVIAQPWEVEADVLAVPVLKDGAPSELHVELDRRLDAALSDLREIGEQKGSAWSGTLIRGREIGRRLGAGHGGGRGRRVRSGRRRAPGCGRRAPPDGSRGAPPGGLAAGRAAGRGWPRCGATVELVVGASWRAARSRPRSTARTWRRCRPTLDEVVVVVAAGDAVGAGCRRGARPDHRRGHATGAERLSQRAANDVSPEVLADEASVDRPGARAGAHRLRARGGRGAGHGHVPVGRPRLVQPAPVHRAALRAGRRRPMPGAGCWRWWARASRSTRAASASSPPSAWTT